VATQGNHKPAEGAQATVIGPVWLTAVLRRAGTLPGGRVRRLKLLGRQRTAGGSLARCAVEYSKGAPSDLPRRLLVKLPRPDRPVELLDGMGRKEVAFYRDVAPTLSGVPVPRCLAADRVAAGQWHLVLEDLSDTHTQTQWPVPPAEDACAAAIDALAALHAALWAHQRLERDFGGLPTAEDVADNTRRATELAARFVAFLGDRLPPARRRCFEHAVGGLSRLWEWWCDRHARTLVHGDAHAWNMLFPRAAGSDGERGPTTRVYLVDWQNWQVGPPTLDLATFIVLD
jgi:aminoglycoside/choline kinase family phosphotransferase